MEIVQYLSREHHCDPLRKNVAEENSLICAARNGHLNVIEYFSRELNIDPNAPGPRNRKQLFAMQQVAGISMLCDT
jgi:Tfp pilus assembly protein PilF